MPVGCRHTTAGDALDAEAAPYARGCVVRVQWKGLQHYAISPVSSWRGEGAYARRREGWKQVIRYAFHLLFLLRGVDIYSSLLYSVDPRLGKFGLHARRMSRWLPGARTVVMT